MELDPGDSAVTDICENQTEIAEEEATKKTLYASPRHILLNILAVLIFLINLALIIILRISPRCRKHVRFSIRCIIIQVIQVRFSITQFSITLRLFACLKSSNFECKPTTALQRYNLIILSLAVTDMLVGVILPFQTLRMKW